MKFQWHVDVYITVTRNQGINLRILGPWCLVWGHLIPGTIIRLVAAMLKLVKKLFKRIQWSSIVVLDECAGDNFYKIPVYEYRLVSILKYNFYFSRHWENERKYNTEHVYI